MSGKRLLSRQDAAAYLGVSLATIDRMIRDREVTITRIGKRVKFDQDDLDAYIDRSKVYAEAETETEGT